MDTLPFSTEARDRMTIKVSPEAHYNLRVVSAMIGTQMHIAAEQAIANWCNYVLTQRQDQSGDFHGEPHAPVTPSKISAVSIKADRKSRAIK